MNEDLITVKKEKPPIIQVIVTAVFVTIMVFISDMHKALYVLSLAAILFAIPYGVYFMSKVIISLKDKEKFVVINRKSLKNKEAEAFVKENRRITDKYHLIKSILFSVILTAELSYIGFNVPLGPKRSRMIIISFVTAFAVYLYMDSSLRKTISKRHKTIVAMCDPEYIYELMDLTRMQILTDLEKSITLYVQALASYYMDDYDTMFLKIEKVGEINKNKGLEVSAAELQGAACIKMGNVEGYSDAYELIYSLQEDNPKDKKLHTICDSAIRRLNVQFGLSERTPDKVLDLAVESVNEQNIYELVRMEYTFILAELQEMKGLTELAQANYKTVAEYGDKMKIRDIAAERIAG